MRAERTAPVRIFLVVVLGAVSLFACGGDPAEPTRPETAEGAYDTTIEAQQEVQSALRTAATAEETYYTANMTYTTSVAELERQGFTMGTGATITIPRADAAGFCIEATHASLDATFMYDSSKVEVTEGTC